MIKVIIFDLDGVLVDTKNIHFESLNQALKKNNIVPITYSDHSKVFDGLPTVEKLKILSKQKKISSLKRKKILKEKQILTKKNLKRNIKFKPNLQKIFKHLSSKYKIAVATNAVKQTLQVCLKKLKIKNYIDYVLSNEDINNPKPNPEIYFRIFIKFGIFPYESLILEDSSYGRQAAISSSGNLLPIKNIKDVNLKNIKNTIQLIQKKMINKKKINQWEDSELNVLIPMAGAGKRFADAGYTFPKPLIEIDNKPMIQWVLDSLNIKANYIFLVLKEHQDKFNIGSVLKILKPNCKVIEINSLTEGAACTTLLAEKYIDNKNPLIIANSDQYIKWNSSKIMYDIQNKNYDGAILTFNSIHPKWSYVKVDENNVVTEVAEKKVISNKATVGIYYWKHGSDYVEYAKRMIKKNIRTNNEFYVCPVFNEAIEDKKIIKSIKIDQMTGLGTPEDLDIFLKKILK